MTTSYSYDSRDQLTGDGQNAFEYDGTGNRLTHVYDPSGSPVTYNYQTDTGNRLTNDGIWDYAYNNEGNVTKKTKGELDWRSASTGSQSGICWQDASSNCSSMPNTSSRYAIAGEKAPSSVAITAPYWMTLARTPNVSRGGPRSLNE